MKHKIFFSLLFVLVSLLPGWSQITTMHATFIPIPAVEIDTNSFIKKETGLDTIVPVPDGFSYNFPFDILRSGNNYVISPTFSLQEHANINVQKTYYVSISTGNDANDGLTPGTAFKSAYTAAIKADVDRIIISKGTYPYANALRNYVPNRSIEWIGDLTTGTGDSVWITRSINEKLSSGWTATSNYYSATYTISGGDTLGAVFDKANLDAYGYADDLVLRGSIGDVNTNPGSYFVSTNTIYIRTIDSRAPDSDIELVGKNGSINSLNGRLTTGTHYFKDINFRHSGLSCIVADSTGGLNVYIENSRIMAGSFVFDGASEVILFNVHAGKTASDIANYDPEDGIYINAVEYNCHFVNTAESGSGTDLQASTVHNGCKILRLNSSYGITQGQNVADVNSSQTFMLNCDFYGAIPASSSGFYSSGPGVTAWLENCSSTQTVGIFDIQNNALDTIYSRFFTSSQTNDIGGALNPYAPDETFGLKVSEMMETNIIIEDDYLYVAKKGDGEYLSAKLPASKLFLNSGALLESGAITGAINFPQKFNRGISINGASGAALSVKALSATTPAIKAIAFTGHTGNLLEYYNESNTLIQRILPNGRMFIGDLASSDTSSVFSALYSVGNPLYEFGGKVTGQQVSLKMFSGSNYWAHTYQGNNFNGDFILRYNSLSGGRLFRFSTSGVLNVSVGFQIADAAPSGQYLRGNGTNYVSSTIGISDISAIKRASGTLDFPSTNDLNTSDLTITITGAALNDPVTLGMPNGSVIVNTYYSAWVSATDTVTVRFTNHSGSVQDPASGTFKVSIIQ